MKQTEGDGGRKVRSVDGGAGKASAGAGGGRERGRKRGRTRERSPASLVHSTAPWQRTSAHEDSDRTAASEAAHADRREGGRERIRKGAEFFRQPSSARSFQHMGATEDQMERERGMLYDEISRSGLSI